MRLLSRIFMAVGFSLLAASAGATPDNPQPGKDYRVLERAQPTDSGNKVEVTEFFWYSCPHCNAFEPYLSDWVKKQGDKIVFKRVPVGFRESFVPQQRLYYALEAMGKADELQKVIFHAIHVERQRLDTEAQIADFIAKQGIDKQKFLDAFNSFGVNAKVRRTGQLQRDYAIDGVPLVAIDGRFVTGPSVVAESTGDAPEAELAAGTLKVMSALVARSTKQAAAPAAPQAAEKPAEKPAAAAAAKKPVAKQPAKQPAKQ